MEEKVVVSVLDRDENNRRRATVLDSGDSAARLVEALIAAGCEAGDISVFTTREVDMQVAFRPAVSIGGDTPGMPSPKAVGALPQASERSSAPRESTVIAATEDGPPPTPVVVSAEAKQSATVSASAAPSVEQGQPAAPAATASVASETAAAPAATGGWGIHLRADRVVWVSIWAVSMVVLVVSLLSTLSRPAPREFLPVSQSEVQDLSSESEPAVLNSADTPLSERDSRVPECARDGQDDCRCADFATQADAQVFYSRIPPGDGHVVDPDGDGMICEFLPALAP